ncbi:MAG TPA: hypothetical protein DCQ26_05490 [Marinilabiliales bacterium]|nr:MAG: hypothetical protein A2W95_05700 [Bacteroidetes bacterium GWA2_40_14]OFX57852.1 MAG: hypothetical protein A2W84_16495 [Bacteroidetes bacterium GWC2_40_13]OFX73977.1 MAG: hypothetical protein A2W96_11720 [Bacteroidetes bacterium GWD2_40_43]OFX93189.1 MAG: hypothetical protein A2W97_06350 [Bacteroidetes bacterium GWE2_40_63]OFY21559.1 MAG: hypothetical protein A2W88_10350 [Bacteroidetes bacterium GWF2_40_13]OFZ24212.1 MAG: hypothetical protein A2437_17485 [Bacteroidetes bacterium RIFOXYC
MNRFLILTLAAMGACSGPKTDQFVINGKITGTQPEKVYLKIYKDKKMNVIDSSEVTAGTFKFMGKVDFPDQYFIQFGSTQNQIVLFVENSPIEVVANLDSIQATTIKGSKVNDEYEALQESKSELNNQMELVYADFKAATDLALKKELEKKLDSLDLVAVGLSKIYIREHPQSILSPFIINREIVYYLELEELEELVNGLDSSLHEYAHTKNLKQRVDLLRTLQPGMLAPEFAQNDTAGNPVNLSDFKGKYLLIDFWASWCGPCRRANPTVVAVYQKFEAKGFAILGISMDKDREKWLQAIAKDGLVWKQVSTLEGWDNPVGKLYGVNSIPHAILIDPDGKIVKRGLHADELDALLSGLIK